MSKGNPNGSNGRKGDKPWTEAIRIAASVRDEKGKRRLRAIAEKTVEEALKGDMSAIKEIGDRLDGKATQPTENRTTVNVKVSQRDIADEFASLIAAVADRGTTHRGSGETQ